MCCVTTVHYAIRVNAKLTQPFAAKKGLRQGDPISPFLFVLCMEYLNRLLKTLRRDPDFNYHPKCAKLHIVQLGFADDLLLFCRGDLVSVGKLFNCFHCLWFGFKSKQKFCLFGGIDSPTQ